MNVKYQNKNRENYSFIAFMIFPASQRYKRLYSHTLRLYFKRCLFASQIVFGLGSFPLTNLFFLRHSCRPSGVHILFFFFVSKNVPLDWGQDFVMATPLPWLCCPFNTKTDYNTKCDSVTMSEILTKLSLLTE